MLADRSETDLSPNQSKPTLESWDVNSRNSKEAFPLLAVVAFPSQRSLCLRNVFIERDKRRIGIDLFHRFHTAFQTPFPPLSPSRDAYRGRSGLAVLSRHPFDALPPSFDRSFYQRHEEETRLRELHRGSRGEGGGGGWKEEGEERGGERRKKGGRGREKRGSRRSVHARGNASCMPIVGRISRGT